jgi:diguanylate cyclase (GGDEF)-like protein
LATDIHPSGDRAPTPGHRHLPALLREVVAEESVEAVLARVVATLRELVRCEDVVVWQLNAAGSLVAAVVDGEDEEAIRSLSVALGEGLTGKAALHRRPIVSNDAHVDPNAGYVPGTIRTPEAVACMPLVGREHLLGVLTLYRQGEQRFFAADEVELVADFAAVAALALDNARVRCKLERLATTDELTGLASRRFFMEQLEREVASATRYGSPLSLLLLDLDNLKLINDTHGHSAGDRALRLVAEGVCDQVRAPDLAARLGGDEFAVLLREAEPAAVELLAERVRLALTLHVESFSLTISVGCSTFRSGTAADLLEDADRALYETKRATGTGRSIEAPGASLVEASSTPATGGAAAKRDEEVMAERYCRLRNAGYSLEAALALAMDRSGESPDPAGA